MAKVIWDGTQASRLLQHNADNTAAAIGNIAKEFSPQGQLARAQAENTMADMAATDEARNVMLDVINQPAEAAEDRPPTVRAAGRGDR
jgi:hypothetical protein